VNIKPKRYSLSDKPVVFYGDFLVVECEIYSPRSAAGRTVHLFLDDDDVTELLRECRDAASRHRSDPEHKPVRWADVGMVKRNPMDDLADLARGYGS
jgi:hypothetical protein